MAKRIQRKRTKGWRMPPNTVYVGRPTKWGNPWTPANVSKVVIVKQPNAPQQFESGGTATVAECVVYYREDILDGSIGLSAEEIQNELRGKDLACWCPLDKPCHADVLLELANK
jgi:hypothetical protein